MTVSSRPQKATCTRRRGQTLLAGLSVMALTVVAGCDAHKPQEGVIGYVSGFAGAVSAEEPRAALIGEDVLTAGGTAADAAVAMASTLTVTLPSRAGWGGGGVCMSRLPQEGKPVKVYAFMPEVLPGGGFVPGMPRGLYALHAASGTMRWETLLTEAENLARFGTPVSRAFAKDLAHVGQGVDLHGEAAVPFLKDGRLLKEGERMVQLRAASTLSALRTKGVGDAYAGNLARIIADELPDLAQQRRGVLRRYSAQKLDPIVVETRGNEDLYLPPAPFAGPIAAKAWSNAENAGNAVAARVGTLPAPVPYGSTGFVVADRGGMTVSCVLSMGRLFGSGQTLGATSMFGFQPITTEFDVKSMMPLLIGNRHNHDLRLAAAGAGASAISDALQFAYGSYGLKTVAQSSVTEVAKDGDQMTRVTGVYCPDGAPSKVDTCSVPFDPRGSGVSRMVGVEFTGDGSPFGNIQFK